MELKVIGVTLVTHGKGTDTLFIETNLPQGTFPFTGMATITTPIAKGRGVQYVKDNFPGVPFENLGE